MLISGLKGLNGRIILVQMICFTPFSQRNYTKYTKKGPKGFIILLVMLIY